METWVGICTSKKRPQRFWCCCVSGSSDVQLLFIKGILRAILGTIGICLVSKNSHSEICPVDIFLAWHNKIHSKHLL